MLADPHISSLGYLASTLISRLQVFFFNKKWKEKSSSQIGWLSLQTAALACPRMRSLNQWKSS